MHRTWNDLHCPFSVSLKVRKWKPRSHLVQPTKIPQPRPNPFDFVYPYSRTHAKRHAIKFPSEPFPISVRAYHFITNGSITSELLYNKTYLLSSFFSVSQTGSRLPNSTMDSPASSHPYYPLTASIPSYVANDSSVLRLLVTFGLMVGVVTGLAYWQTIQSPLRLRPIDRFSVVWFALCWYSPCGPCDDDFYSDEANVFPLTRWILTCRI